MFKVLIDLWQESRILRSVGSNRRNGEEHDACYHYLLLPTVLKGVVTSLNIRGQRSGACFRTSGDGVLETYFIYRGALATAASTRLKTMRLKGWQC